MAILSNVKKFLDQQRVSYEVTSHPEGSTFPQIAALLQRSGKPFAKVVLVKTEEGFVMCVLPAYELIDIGRLEKVLGKKGTVRIATEEEFKSLFPDCEIGAMPPFGNLYHIPVYLDRRLAEYDDLYFAGGRHTETVSLGMEVYRRLISPKIAEFGRVIRPKAA
ncbi:MAG TPA: YbaK/EbsC family protein [Candidatus Manganitrophaceae bacterium]|nr:YbaK/EbsC family protein [Candidatus Manganitrophaceae bacterium]